MSLTLRGWVNGKPHPIEWDGIMFVSAEYVNKELELKFDGTREDSEDQQQLFIRLKESSTSDLVDQVITTIMENGSDYEKWCLEESIIKHSVRYRHSPKVASHIQSRGGIFNCTICGKWHYRDSKIGKKHWAEMHGLMKND